jgi:pimeloyl-ACP methyl ester carboxylesterase
MGLAYTRAGSGPPLVLFHGLGHRRQAWDAVLDRLTPHREVFAIDLPGHGDSPPLDVSGRTVADALTEGVIETFDELGLDRPHVAGNSLGGMIALGAAVSGRAASVTGLSPAGFWRGERDLRYAKGVFKAMQVIGSRLEPVAPRLAGSAKGRALMISTIVSRPALMSQQQAEGDMVAFLAARETVSTILAGAEPFAGEIAADVPVTIAWGSKDRLLNWRQALVARDRLPQATFIRLPGCGHVPMTDDPELTARVLLRGSSRPGIPAASSPAEQALLSGQ